MLQAVRLSKVYQDRTLFEAVSFSIAKGEKVGLIGPNGSGKSTLLRILAGQVEPDEGRVRLAGGSYLAAGLPDANVLRASPESGGERTLGVILSALASDADLVLLDEPTNNLATETIEQLEIAIARHPAGFLIASHDRRFLDRTTTRTLELDPLGRALIAYAASYSRARASKAQAVARQWREYRAQQRVVRRLEADIQATRQQAVSVENRTVNDFLRGRARKVAAKAKARETRLLRVVSDTQRVDKPRDLEKMRLALGGRELHRSLLIEATGISVVRDDRRILDRVDLAVRAGERIAVTGACGAGKTTLLRVLAGEWAPDSGALRRRGDLRIGYLPQDPAETATSDTVLDFVLGMLRAGAGMRQDRARTFLDRFMFRRDEVFKRMRDLSGGERSRAVLAGLMLGEPDLLILDEPTNHLDLDTCWRLEEALADYAGAILAVSHDREFLERLRPDRRIVLPLRT